jgi:hypothetical protein
MAKVRHLVARLIRRCSSVSGGGLSYTSRDMIANSWLAHDYLSRITLQYTNANSFLAYK